MTSNPGFLRPRSHALRARCIPFCVPAFVAAAACTPANGSQDADAGTDGNGSDSQPGMLTVNWSFKNPDGSAASCAPGYGKMKITTNGYFDTVGAGDPQSVLLDCAAGTGTFPLTGRGDGKTYSVIMQETSASGETVFLTDVAGQTAGSYIKAHVVDGKATVSTTFYPTGGWAWIEWSLFGEKVDNYLDSCTDAGIDRVDVTLTDEAAQAATFSSPCTAVAPDLTLTSLHGLGSINKPMAPGEYKITMAAFGNGQQLGTSSGINTLSVLDRNGISLTADPISIRLTNR